MSKKALIVIALLLVVVAGAVIAMRGARQASDPAQPQSTAGLPLQPSHAAPPTPAHDSAHSPRSQTVTESRVPAHFKTPPSKESLRPTLDPEQFTGPTRAAYMAVREIPQTIAQLPCYCYCDEGFGHKSLHSCFEDDHGAHCAVCVNEALLAYRMEKELKLTPAQIRERIIAQYSAGQ
jgi:hypothetical protein